MEKINKIKKHLNLIDKNKTREWDIYTEWELHDPKDCEKTMIISLNKRTEDRRRRIKMSLTFCINGGFRDPYIKENKLRYLTPVIKQFRHHEDIRSDI